MNHRSQEDPQLLKQLQELIPPPGHFAIVERGTPEPGSDSEIVLLGVWQAGATPNQDHSKQAYDVYRAAYSNAVGLLEEAELLAQHTRYSRAVALGITAWEELGKSQIAADYYSGVLSDEEYVRAFKRHDFKTSYLARMAVVGAKAAVAIHPAIGRALEEIRQTALYVSKTQSPSGAFSADDANFVVVRVREHLEYIDYAQDLNGRIGSKALFK